MYTSKDDMIAAFGETEILDLTDRDGDGFADEAVWASIILQTTSLIDGYIGSRFALPLPEVPQLIAQCARWIARYFMAEDHATDRIKYDYEQALKFLTMIREGKLDVGLVPAGTDAPARTRGVMVSEGRETFSPEALDEWSGSSR